ncbi:pyridoxamine 5'-phosphate oxidase family protein [Amycolatopsis thermoflava]|uniref:pyridoxamine 5'-phosphate oxidase family protein n=1 Tax=Amycolatopsis thermoflava TaxID=84480 RepID=UPI00381A372C
MTAIDPPRGLAERLRDTRARLEADVDLWVASSGDAGVHLIPLSYLWDGAALLVATPRDSLTSRNLLADGPGTAGTPRADRTRSARRAPRTPPRPARRPLMRDGHWLG